MPFELVSGVGRGMGVLDGVYVPQDKGKVLGVFHPHWFEMYLTRACKNSQYFRMEWTIYHWKRLFVGFRKT